MDCLWAVFCKPMSDICCCIAIQTLHRWLYVHSIDVLCLWVSVIQSSWVQNTILGSSCRDWGWYRLSMQLANIVSVRFWNDLSDHIQWTSFSHKILIDIDDILVLVLKVFVLWVQRRDISASFWSLRAGSDALVTNCYFLAFRLRVGIVLRDW